MSTAQLLIWSAAVGAIGLVVLLAAADALLSRTTASLKTLAYLTGFWVFVALLSGLIAAIWPATRPMSSVAQVLIGPMCAAMGTYGCIKWLSAHQRDRLMKVCLQSMALTTLVGGPLCLLLPPPWRLPASAVLSVLSMAVVVWLAVRAAQLGDRLAWGLALGCLLGLLLQIGLYSMAIDKGNLPLILQVGVALAGLASAVVTAVVLWRRNRHTQRLSEAHLSRRDPITQLHSSTAIVQRIIHAQERRSRTRRDGALMAVLMFEPERLLSQVGQVGLNDIYIQTARRMQRHAGVVNPVGRYYDRCFVVLIETLHSPRGIRTVGLRVASSLRRPMEVISLGGERISVSNDIAVGIVHMSAAGKDVDQLLHEVQRVAEAARGMRSRAALLDPQTHLAVPLENANLADSWRAMREQRQVLGKTRLSTRKNLSKPGQTRNKPA